ncbi:MAG: excisionase family DNA-binding protein [Candidatus Tectomicrobia bacterium]|uniref:Excisionase family DNA-binding protein n=1 Tax=Tectimicrobiota bacterium TaxID=2528274 RepID=A0A932FVH7_UNCTE|nr:excisionase family DNA-binding protein [Candidatus Tectomicrobia bacterium]
MDIEEASSYLGVSVRTLRRWVASGRVRAKKVSIPSGTCREFKREDLDGLKGKLLPDVLDGAGENGQPEGVTRSPSPPSRPCPIS